MYRYYEEAQVCYAYLADVPTAEAAQITNEDPVAWNDPYQFDRSKWFTRGWTLQELIAPKVVEFYAADWTEIGTKASMTEQLARRTGIDPRVLNGADVSICNVAERLSWASHRQTTKIEDSAYCLIGLFRVNMPLIYGEGHKAFRRLQETILREVEDYTILAWKLRLPRTSDSTSNQNYQIPDLSLSEAMGVARERSRKGHYHDWKLPPLAETPKAFSVDLPLLWSYSDVEQDMLTINLANASMQGGQSNHSPPETTSRGLRVWLPFVECSETTSLAYINCRIRGRLICISLLRATGTGDNVYFRVQLVGARGDRYLFVNPEDLPMFRLRQIYIQPYRKHYSEPFSNTVLVPISPATFVIVEGPDMDGIVGWYDNRDRLIPIPGRTKVVLNGRSPHIIRCVHRERIPFIVILGAQHCELIMMGWEVPQLYRPRCGRPHSEFAPSEHEETEEALAADTNKLSPSDRVSRTFEDVGLTVRVAYKQLASGIAVIISVVPLNGS